MGLVVKDDGWRIRDEVWAQMEVLLPPSPAHPLGCHRPRVPDRAAMNAILLVLRTGCSGRSRSPRSGRERQRPGGQACAQRRSRPQPVRARGGDHLPSDDDRRGDLRCVLLVLCSQGMPPDRRDSQRWARGPVS
jgi:hypothetical protein